MSLANLIQKGGLRGFATATPATFATHAPLIHPTVETVARVAVASTPKEAANDQGLYPDRWCWPKSSAMTGAEIDTFAARLSTFTDKGLTIADVEILSDMLVLRDRDQDDRRVCLECKYFAGHGAGSWRCGNWQAAGVAFRSRDSQLPADLVVQLQQCDGFKETSQLGELP